MNAYSITQSTCYVYKLLGTVDPVNFAVALISLY